MTEVKNKSALQALMGSNPEVEDDVFIPRLDTSIVVRALTGDTINNLRDECTFVVGKGKDTRKETNEEDFAKLLIVAACVNKEFENEALMKRFEAESPADCAQKVLLSGELAKISSKVMEISGFEDDETEIEKVKN